MRIAIIGAGLAGLACAIECERLGVVADVFERDSSVGMKYSFINEIPEIFFRNNDEKDIITELRKNYLISIKPVGKRTKFTMKSPNKTVVVEGELGYFLLRGKSANSVENQLLNMLKKTPIFYNTPADFEELSKKYQYVVVASGKDTEPAQMGIWQNHGQVSLINGIAIGEFDLDGVTVFFNTQYAGSGFAIVSPFSSTQALIEMCIIGHESFQTERLFSRFLKQKRLEHIEFFYTLNPPVFQTGSVKKFRKDNVLLTGRSAGLTERLIGVGAPFAIMSGVLSARAIIQNLDYDLLMRPFQKHIENISAQRNVIEKFENKDYDSLLSLIDTPGIKQLLYNTKVNFADIIGSLLKRM